MNASPVLDDVTQTPMTARNITIRTTTIMTVSSRGTTTILDLAFLTVLLFSASFRLIANSKTHLGEEHIVIYTYIYIYIYMHTLCIYIGNVLTSGMSGLFVYAFGCFFHPKSILLEPLKNMCINNNTAFSDVILTNNSCSDVMLTKQSCFGCYVDNEIMFFGCYFDSK